MQRLREGKSTKTERQKKARAGHTPVQETACTCTEILKEEDKTDKTGQKDSRKRSRSQPQNTEDQNTTEENSKSKRQKETKNRKGTFVFPLARAMRHEPQCGRAVPRIRSYQLEYTASHQNCEVKRAWAYLVLRWGTTWEQCGAVSALSFSSSFFFSFSCPCSCS